MAANHGPGVVARSTALLISLFIAASVVRADQIVMQSGDHIVGRLLALSNETLVVQSELLGTVRLPRSKVVSITFASTASTNLETLAVQTNFRLKEAAPVTNLSVDTAAALPKLGANTNSIQQVRNQLLSTAGPEANRKFNELMGGLISGKLDVNDIRTEAASAASQIRTLKRELGDEADGALDGYLAILEKFLAETSSPADSNSKTANSPRQPKINPTKETE